MLANTAVISTVAFSATDVDGAQGAQPTTTD
jgi:hypothetical protein